MSRAIVSLWLPSLAIDRWSRLTAAQGEAERTLKPTVLVTETAHGPVIDAANPAAQGEGVRAGSRLADARMLYPALVAVSCDHEGNQRTLERMALSVQRWGPWSMVDGGDALLLDATNSAHLFGGEAAMLAEMEAHFAMNGYAVRLAIAPTSGAAWALSHHGPQGALVADEGGLAAALAPLPSAALRLSEETGLLLSRLGLKTIGDLMAVPRESLARRFRNRRSAEANPLTRLDQLFGRLHEPLVPLIEEQPLMAQRRLLEPVRHRDLLGHVLDDLTLDLARSLEAARKGARRLSLQLFRVDGDMIEREVELASPSRDPAHLARLFEERLDDVDAGFGIDQLRLVARWAEGLDIHQEQLDAQAAEGSALPVLIDRLVMRLGKARVSRLKAYASHLPERAQRRIAPGAEVAAEQYDLGLHRRPLKLLDRPEGISVIYMTPDGLPRRFRWRGAMHDIVKAEGPERIAPEWWREKSSARLRDYYRIEDGQGRRYWIYRSGLIGDGRGGIPDWYMHGLFA